jgi:hypothetical protein
MKREILPMFPDATATRAVILGLPFDQLADLDFVAFEIETRTPLLMA